MEEFEPLFTTHDGKQVYLGDSWWYVKLDSYTISQTNTTNYKSKQNNKAKVLRFSTEALAKEYVKSFIEKHIFVVDFPWYRTFHVYGTRSEVEGWSKQHLPTIKSEAQLVIQGSGGIQIEKMSNTIII